MNFDNDAASWDSEKRVNRSRVIAQEIDRVILKENVHNVMEFGCGTGLISFNLIDKFQNITLVDSSKGMIEELNSKIRDSAASNMKAVLTNINEESILTDKYDAIYSSMVLHHILDTKMTLTNLYDLLREGGTLCLVDLDEEDGSFHSNYENYDGHNGFNQIRLSNLMKDIGFKHIEAYTFFRDIKVIDERNIDYSLFIMRGIK